MEDGLSPIAALLVLLLGHVLFSLALAKMASRVGEDETPWLAWVPIVNILVLLKIAEKPYWWMLFLFIPFINILAIILINMAVSRRFGLPQIVGLVVTLLGPVTYFYYLFLAFGTPGPKNDRIVSVVPVDVPAAGVPNRELVAYVRECRAAGWNDETIVKSAREQGWDVATIDASLRA